MEDKLTRDERLRLESLAQAVARYAMRPASTGELLSTARAFLTYITAGPAVDGGDQ